MYICPTCGKEFKTEQEIVKHFLKCWKEKNPRHKSKEAPRSAELVHKEVNPSVEDFFTKFGENVNES